MFYVEQEAQVHAIHTFEPPFRRTSPNKDWIVRAENRLRRKSVLVSPITARIWLISAWREGCAITGNDLC